MFAQGIELTAEERRWLTAHPEIEITSYSEAAPFGFLSDGGEYIGAIPDIAMRIQELLGVRIAFRGVGYGQLLEQVAKGEADCTTLNDPLDANYEVHYSKTEDFLFLPFSLFVKKDSSLAQEHPDSVSGRTIALCEGWDLNNPSLEVLEGNSFVFGKTMLDCLNLVLRGEADGFFDVHSEVTYLLDRHSITDIQLFRMYREGYSAAFFVRKDWPELRSALDKAIAAIPKSEIQGYLKTWNAYLDEGSYQLAAAVLTPEERKWIKDNPVVHVGVDPAYTPFEFLDSNGTHQGVAADYLSEIGAVTGIQFKIVKSATWAETLENARNYGCDMVSGIVSTPARTGYLQFTQPFAHLPLAIITREDTPFVSGLNKLSGKRIGVVDGYAVQEWIATDYPDINLVPARSTEEALTMLVDGDVDACVEAILPASHSMAKLSLENLRFSGETPYEYELSLAVRRDWPVLARILDKSLATIPDSKREEILSRWAPIHYTREFNYGNLWKVLAVSAIVIAFIAYWNRRLSRIVAARTAELRIEYDKQRESDLRFKAIFNQTFQLIGMLSPDGRILAANETALKFRGLVESDVIDKPFWETPWWEHSPDLQDLLRESVQRAALGEFVRFETTHIDAEGKTHTIDFSLQPVKDESGNVVLLIPEGRDITERKQAEQAVLQSELQYRTLFEAANDAIFVLEDGRFVECNPRTLEIFGCTREQIIGQVPWQLSPVVQPDGRNSQTKAMEFIASALNGTPQSFEWLHIRHDGTEFNAEVSLTRMNQDGKIQLLAFVRDITKRRQAELALKKSEEQFRTLFDLVPFPCVVNDLDGRYVLVNQAFTEFTGISADEAIGRTMKEVGLIRVDERSDRVMDKLRDVGFVHNVESAIRRPDGQVRQSLYSCRLLAGEPPMVLTVTVDITERILSEQRLHESEERYRAFFNNTSDGIYRLEAEPPIDSHLPEDTLFELVMERTFLAECNDAFARMYGFPNPEAMTGMRLKDMMAADPRNVDYLRQYLRSGFRIENVESSGVDLSGATHHFINSFVGFVENGLLTRAWGVQRDVTEQRRLDEKLRERTEMIRALVDTSRDWIWTMNVDGVHTYSNPAVQSILGYLPSEIEGKVGLELMHDDDRTAIGQSLAGWIAEKRGWQAVLTRWRHKDGTWRYLESNAVPIVSESGELQGFRGVDRDITARVQAEEALRLSESKLTSIFRAAPAGIALIKDRIILEANETLCHMTGYSHDELVGRNARMFYLTDEEFERVGAERMRQLTLSREQGSGGVETQWSRRNGEVIDVFVSAALVDEQTFEHGIIVAALDITERKRAAEEALLRQQQLVHADKMVSLGTLVAGVAHEINNPDSFARTSITACRPTAFPYLRYVNALTTFRSFWRIFLRKRPFNLTRKYLIARWNLSLY
ncbi:MAG: hypothetical protein AMXMBFR84_22690 [Candidatus Hydrogenedentota bacterium]